MNEQAKFDVEIAFCPKCGKATVEASDAAKKFAGDPSTKACNGCGIFFRVFPNRTTGSEVIIAAWNYETR